MCKIDTITMTPKEKLYASLDVRTRTATLTFPQDPPPKRPISFLSRFKGNKKGSFVSFIFLLFLFLFPSVASSSSSLYKTLLSTAYRIMYLYHALVSGSKVAGVPVIKQLTNEESIAIQLKVDLLYSEL